ncbi:amino acid ABC transporter permease [Primorskyibacter flagellatus]|uniref:Amino acid ABC transporter permease n=1 Tax=Primorskyibacter flagellatus TaxID=1387277 RepID=A0A916ZWP6_9RHOB|nr:amino acid ABC transporter permease [Primorskyibacter flagellatus]GGE17138.1 amino acid ABC transporter permease [Primorskyibacter flagellatus]
MSDTHAETVAFVRETMLPQKAPPASTVGPLGWAKANLFSSYVNGALTILSAAFIVFVLYEILPWLISPTWEGTSLTNCRELLAAAGDDRGACWGVIRERWQQLMFGFYPRTEYWRPVLTFIFLLVAIAPILFAQFVPAKVAYFSALFPFIAVWLLWGGTIWGPVLALLGFVVGFVVFRYASRAIAPALALAAGVVAAIIWWSVITPFVEPDLSRILPIGIRSVQSREFGGFMLSITIGVTAIMCSLPIGILLALGRQSDLPLVKSICVGFIEFIRGVPLITLLFVASVLLNIFLPPGTNFDIILRVMIMVTLFAAAYMAEVIRGGLAALPKGQYEGADSLGLDYWQAQRLIIMPQALKISIPGIVSTFIGVFKDTTLVSIISMFDPIGLSNAIRADTAWNGVYWELFIFIGFVFFVFCFSMSRYSMYLERKLNTGHR